MFAGPASAAPDTSAASLGTADASALTAQARAELNAAPAIKVADADWSLTVKPVKVTPAPVVVAPTPAPAATPAASRSAQRAAATPAPAAATASAPAVEEKKAAPAPAAAVSGNAVLDIAGRYVGVPYVYGGGSPSGFDCSGFTQYVYAQVGINLPRGSGAQRNAGTVVSRADAKPGDLIWTPGHVAIYAGGNSQIDAPRPGKTIQYRAIWQSNPTFIRLG